MTVPDRGHRAPWWFAPIGFLIGTAGALCGVGGGLFAGPLLHLARGLELRKAAASALLTVLGTTLAATLVESTRPDSRLDGAVVVALACGALIGSQLGFRVAQRLPEQVLRRAFALVLLVAALRLLYSGEAVGGGLALGATGRALAALAIGATGGFLTPILGIGGGIVMVPALFFSLEGLGFGGARACSLAAGAVASLRSLWLHARAGNVDRRGGLPIAIGAVLGAWAGVGLAHEPALAGWGRILLGGLLLFQATRFARARARPGQA
jgi:uncharacterized membrane protein YfcA